MAKKKKQKAAGMQISGRLESPHVRRLVQLAIAEDLAQGDITSRLSLTEGLEATAVILAREPMVVCGLEIINIIFSELGWSVAVKNLVSEGARVKANEPLANLSGKAYELLAAERTILNFLQRICGVATYTSKVVSKSGGITVLDTRKTMPGWRVLDKHAVKVGGGANHRFGLGDMILVKNNHVDLAQSTVFDLVTHLKAAKPPHLPLEVEVRDQAELESALHAGADIVMLDNMNNREIGRSLALVNRLKPGTLVEISGGIDADRFKALKKIGVKLVSMGALTTQAPNVDISLRVTKR